VVYGLCETVRLEEIQVLGVDGGDEVVDAGHLHDGEYCDEDEPRGGDLFEGGEAVQSTPNAADGFLLFFLALLSPAVGFVEERGHFRDGVVVVVMNLFFVVGVRGVCRGGRFFGFFDDFTDSFVRICRHYAELYNYN